MAKPRKNRIMVSARLRPKAIDRLDKFAATINVIDDIDWKVSKSDIIEMALMSMSFEQLVAAAKEFY